MKRLLFALGLPMTSTSLGQTGSMALWEKIRNVFFFEPLHAYFWSEPHEKFI